MLPVRYRGSKGKAFGVGEVFGVLPLIRAPRPMHVYLKSDW